MHVTCLSAAKECQVNTVAVHFDAGQILGRGITVALLLFRGGFWAVQFSLHCWAVCVRRADAYQHKDHSQTSNFYHCKLLEGTAMWLKANYRQNGLNWKRSKQIRGQIAYYIIHISSSSLDIKNCHTISVTTMESRPLILYVQWEGQKIAMVTMFMHTLSKVTVFSATTMISDNNCLSVLVQTLGVCMIVIAIVISNSQCVNCSSVHVSLLCYILHAVW